MNHSLAINLRTSIYGWKTYISRKAQPNLSKEKKKKDIDSPSTIKEIKIEVENSPPRKYYISSNFENTFTELLKNM